MLQSAPFIRIVLLILVRLRYGTHSCAHRTDIAAAHELPVVLAFLVEVSQEKIIFFTILLLHEDLLLNRNLHASDLSLVGDTSCICWNHAKRLGIA